MSDPTEAARGEVTEAVASPMLASTAAGTGFRRPPPLPVEVRIPPWLAFAPAGFWARAAYVACGVGLGLLWAIPLFCWLRGGLSEFYGENRTWGLTEWVMLFIRVVCVPVVETLLGYGMLVALSACRIRASLQLWVWAAVWAWTHYWYPGNALVVFGPFVIFGSCMIAYRRRAAAEAIRMTAILHIAYNGAGELLALLLRWALG